MKRKNWFIASLVGVLFSAVTAQAVYLKINIDNVKVDFDKATSRLVLTLTGRNLEGITTATLDVRCSGVAIQDVEAIPKSFQNGDGNLQFTMPIPTHGTSCRYQLVDKTPGLRVADATKTATFVAPQEFDLNALGAAQAFQSAVDMEKAMASQNTDPLGTQQSSGASAGPTEVRADIIYVSVATSPYQDSQFVSGLDSAAFQIFATDTKGKRVLLHRSTSFTQQRLPMTLGLVMDSSGSMKEGSSGASSFSKHDHAVTAAKKVIDAMANMTVDNRKSNGFVINFNSDPTGNNFYFNNALLNPLKDQKEDAAVKLLTENPGDLSSWVNLPQTSRTAAVRIQGDTPMRDAISNAADEIILAKKYDEDHPSAELVEKQTKYPEDAILKYMASHPGVTHDEASVKSPGLENWQSKEIDDLRRNGGVSRGRSVLFVISDGLDSSGTKGFKFEDLARKLRTADIQLYGINFADAQGNVENDLIKLARYSGGEAIAVPNTSSDSQIATIVSSFSDHVIQSLLNQYSVTFDDSDQECRKVEVVVHNLNQAQFIYDKKISDLYDSAKAEASKPYNERHDQAYAKYEAGRSAAQNIFNQKLMNDKAQYDASPQAITDDAWDRKFELGKYAPRGYEVSGGGYDNMEVGKNHKTYRSRQAIEAICDYWRSADKTYGDVKYGPIRYCGPGRGKDGDAQFQKEIGLGLVTTDRIVLPAERGFVHMGFQYPEFSFPETFNFPSLSDWTKSQVTESYDQWNQKKIQTLGQPWIDSFPQLYARHISTIGICDDKTLDTLASDRSSTTQFQSVNTGRTYDPYSH